MSFSYGSENRWYDQFFEKGKAINAAEFVCANALVVGEHHGALAVTVMAAGAVKVAADKKAVIRKTGRLPTSPARPK